VSYPGKDMRLVYQIGGYLSLMAPKVSLELPVCYLTASSRSSVGTSATFERGVSNFFLLPRVAFLYKYSKPSPMLMCPSFVRKAPHPGLEPLFLSIPFLLQFNYINVINMPISSYTLNHYSAYPVAPEDGTGESCLNFLPAVYLVFYWHTYCIYDSSSLA